MLSLWSPETCPALLNDRYFFVWVQIDPAGGLAAEPGVLSLPASGASPDTYPEVKVDTNGRVTAGASLAAADLRDHTYTAPATS